MMMNQPEIRINFLAELQNKLADCEYAIIKSSAQKLAEWPVNADIDMAIKKSDAIKILHFVHQNENVKSCKVLKKSFMWQLYIFLNDGSLLALDFIFQFKHQSTHLLSNGELLFNRKKNNSGLSQASLEVETFFIRLFYMMNKKAIAEKYVKMISNYSDEQKSSCLHFFNQKLSIQIQSLDEVILTQNLGTLIRNKIKNKPENKWMKGFMNKLNYMADTIKDSFQWDGIIVTFSGVDGAGKSTIIENIKTKIEKEMRCRTVVIRHRPSLLPIISALRHGKEKAEKLSMQTLPRQGKNKSSLSSLFRFAYYYFDYFIGQFYVQLKYVSRGYVVLYDRYYFDFVHDARRSNIALSKKFTEPFYSFLLKPKLNFFLTAPADLILQRKQELSAETINELTAEYTTYFDKLSKKFKHSKYLVVNNIVLNETIQNIYSEIDKAKNKR